VLILVSKLNLVIKQVWQGQAGVISSACEVLMLVSKLNLVIKQVWQGQAVVIFRV